MKHVLVGYDDITGRLIFIAPINEEMAAGLVAGGFDQDDPQGIGCYRVRGVALFVEPAPSSDDEQAGEK